MKQTDNFKKHTHNNPIQRLLLWNFFNHLLKLIPKDTESILDVGCGEGFTLNRLRINGIGKRLEGIEYLDSAIELGKINNPEIKITKGDIYRLPFKDNSFEVVMCTEVLEHLEEPERALKELIRVSKKYLVVSVPNEPFFMFAQLVRGKNWSRLGNDIEHINHWTHFGFIKFVKKQNVKVLKVYDPFAWTMVFIEKNK